jgi:mono/diheme cytochrome c family protein
MIARENQGIRQLSQRSVRFAISTWSAIWIAMGLTGSLVAQSSPIDFTASVEPLFKSHCIQCHGPNNQESGYRLDVREIALRGGDSSEEAIVPMSSKASRLLALVRGEIPDLAMPPKDSGIPALSETETETIARWIDEGADWPESANSELPDPFNWWSLKRLEPPQLPMERDNPIDAFIVAKLEQQGLTLSEEADARTLCRRLFFDLIGLPPSPEQLDSFEKASHENLNKAYCELVDTLLASQHYGEKWARHWLDVVHYGDTHGYDKDQPRPNAWPYRDYVIRSFNQDKPYRQFIREQIAGDALYPNSRDGIEALGFLSAGPWDFIGHVEVSESKIDGKIARHLDRDDILGNVVGTLCSATVQCAQCHNHKFDPFSQEDYYALQAVFSAIDRADRAYDRDAKVAEARGHLAAQKKQITNQLETLERSIEEQCSPEIQVLDAAIAVAEKSVSATRPTEYGWHSEIAKDQSTVKWVQVDLGHAVPVERVVLQPTWDDFNSVGKGFGFPKRFRIELSDDPDFATPSSHVVSHEQNDFAAPGIEPQSFSFQGKAGRYIRVTATKLAPRMDDYIFALAELIVIGVDSNDVDSNDLAKNRPVQALDSIEAPARWAAKNLTDGLFPTDPNPAKILELKEQRTQLIVSRVDQATQLDHQRLRQQRADVEAQIASLPPQSVVYAGTVHRGSGNFVGTGGQGGKPRPIHLLARGQVTRPIREVSAGTIATGANQVNRFPIAPAGSESDRRVAMADWIVADENPLTWRSIVNRVWQYHFGIGIVATSNDFGRMGELPSHPELLDWLAADFRDQGGSLKKLHRLIVTSATYRQSSSTQNQQALRVDPTNRMLWKQNRRRLDAEAIRDSVLAVSGGLDLSAGGPGWQDFVVKNPEHSPHYEYRLADPHDKRTWRRSIYRFIVRSQTQPFLTVLNCADPSMRVERRNENDSPQQALALLNNNFMLVQSEQLAARVQKDASSTLEEQVKYAYLLATGNQLTEEKRRSLVDFVERHGLTNLCRVLFNTNEFIFVD